MKITVTYQENKKLKSKLLVIEKGVHLDEELDKFDNIIKIKEHKKIAKSFFFKNKKKEILLLFKQLDLMLQTHLSLNEALELILETNKNSEIENIITSLQNAIIQNYPIDLALKEYKNYIGSLPIAFLKQGLENGTIKNSTHSIVILLEQELEMVKKLGEKLRYPFFLILSLITSMTIIFIYVVPSFEFIFKSLGDNLPLSTQILLLVNKLLTTYWDMVFLLLFSFVGVVVLIMKIYKSYFDKLQLLILPTSGIVRYYQLYKLFLSVYISIESKYQFQTAISNATETISNLYLKKTMKKIESGIKNGENIAELFSKDTLFDQLVIKLLYTAQNTGAYEIVLRDITRYYKEGFELKLKRVTSVIEPLIISIIAFVVLWLVLAIMVPIWQLSATGL